MFEAGGVDRREAMARVALLLGATALPAQAFAAASGKARRYLAPSQFALLSAVADTVLPATDTPGALAAKVPARLDAMLANWASPATREGLSAALLRINAAAKTATGKNFDKLDARQRNAFLLTHDAAALKQLPLPPGVTDQPYRPARNFADVDYWRLKQLIIDLYYFSPEAVATELVYEHVPGKFEPSIKLTPTSRPYLGLGPF
ncbi:MAG: gluconate 2-dehydrogenase subunit 3 family protein [Novosphingobium sp.]|nr:gluconate 2-dehydrogenase subunit 3 family protein [Novosphingobium sp.]